MRVNEGISALRQRRESAVLSIGNFDGVHAGHRAIIERMKSLAAGGPLVIATFEPHPLTVLNPAKSLSRLTPFGLKKRLLADIGIDELIVLPPTPEVLGLTAEAFWQLLRDETRPAHIVEGHSFNFGKDRAGTIERLREWAAGSPVTVHQIECMGRQLVGGGHVEVSSSVVRALLGEGRVEDAAICLDRPYRLTGRVVRGFGRGRTIGVPTANLDCGDGLIPADSVYAARCAIDGRPYAVALSIGSTPTFEQARLQVEAHVLDFEGDLYDQSLEVDLLRHLRGQTKYLSTDALVAQIRHDLADVRAIAHV
ncbi:MAG TPA: riboflavin biosynthesis protein RibF [Tepidisphaeraceae bacterium]|jgi:riboflavin kinase/FMN adenylyltransferase